MIHRGVYADESHGGGYADGKQRMELSYHVVLLNEIVTRVILAVLRFRGQYECYLGGYHQRTFPECKRV